jgi:hypothetical protein
MRQSETPEETVAQGRPKQACRPDFDCAGCGLGVNGEHPPASCPKCGGFKFTPTRPIFQDIAAVIRRVRVDAQEGAKAMTVRGHRKAPFIVAQFRLAEEAMERAHRALFVEGNAQ